MGWWMFEPDIVTPAGIKQAYPIHPKAPAHLRWSTRAIKGLVYMVTDNNEVRLSVHLISCANIGLTRVCFFNYTQTWVCNVFDGHQRTARVWRTSGMGIFNC